MLFGILQDSWDVFGFTIHVIEMFLLKECGEDMTASWPFI